MKQILIITWSLALIVLLFFSFKNLIITKDASRLIDHGKNTEIFCVNKLDSLLKNNDYVLLTIAFGDCSVCNIFQSNIIPDNYPVARYYIDATYHKKNMLVLQSLYFTGFPLSYIIDQDYNAIGCIQGLARLNERMDSIIYRQYKLQPHLIPNISKDKTYFALSNSFKSLLSHFRANDKDMKKFAEKSLSAGSFFFNNYLMYKYYEKKIIKLILPTITKMKYSKI